MTTQEETHNNRRRRRGGGDGAGTGSRRGRPVTWRDLPDFCDAAAAVSAATFGARRLPEIRALYRQTTPFSTDESSSSIRQERCKLEDTLKSGGCQTSSRHLRRRATSHSSRERHRFPAGVSSVAISSTALSNGDDANSDMKLLEASASGTETLPSRRKRRKIVKTLCQEHQGWMSDEFGNADDTTTAGNKAAEEPSASVVNRKVHWIPTHLWHAKRFVMESLWGWKVPIVHSNRGAKAALRLVQQGKTLIQDVSYTYQPICLEIPGDQFDVLVTEMSRIIPGFRANVKERRVLDGMLHHMECFPLRTIGPVQWITLPHLLFDDSTRRGDNLTQMNHEQPSTLYLFLWTQVSIRSETLECLEQWVASCRTRSIGGIAVHASIPGGMACLRLRGHAVGSCLQSAWSTLGWDSFVVDVVVSDKWISTLNHGKLVSLTSRDSDEIGTERCTVYGVIHCHRDPDLLCNRGSIGLDLWCPPRVASDILVALIVQGGACPIGLVEQTHIALEAMPPVPMFPRDFVDTVAGVEYWTGACREWILYRSCLEAGSGRISISSSLPMKSVDWSSLMSTSDGGTALVRGSFGLPFLQLFPAMHTQTQEAPPRCPPPPPRRNRRPSRPPTDLVHMPPLPRERMTEHQSLCQSLLESLSLPALILCHVVVSGKGTLVAGDTVFDYSDPQRRYPLGRITCGAFSYSRGSFHGLAVCGASRVLEAMVVARSFVWTNSSPWGRRECRLAVWTGNCSAKHLGSLSFLF